mgnify:CR=1 FL=1
MWLTRPLQERSTQIFLGVLFAAVVLVTFLHLFMPQDSALHVSAFTVTLLGKYLCYALLAVAVDLVWGYLGILSLGKRYTNARLEAACRRALPAGICSYKGIHNILKNKLDQLEPDPPPATPLPTHTNIRGENYYK